MKLWNVELLLGTNLGKRKQNLLQANNYISTEIGEILYQSKEMETRPIGFTSDNMFINQYVRVATKLSPMQLLMKIKDIEHKMGRVYGKPLPGERYTSRIIDIDILRYENISIKSKILTIPHHQIETRGFVKELIEGQ